MDFAGFDQETWRHRLPATRLLSMTTKSERDAAESANACRYSELPYFEAPCMLIIDPMHNLFLCSAKHFMKSIVIGRMMLSNAQFDLRQQRIDRIAAGRITYKI